VDHVDVYHGTRVADPYRWLEEDVRTSEEVAEWVAAQNAVARAHLDALPMREAIHKRLTELWNYDRYSTPTERGGRYFFTKNDGLQNQSVFYVADPLDAEPRVLLDPNTWSDDGTVALSGTSISDDGRYVAYGVQDAGSDWRTWHVLEVATGRKLGDEVHWTKAGGVSWTPDGRGFFYSRYPEPDQGAAFQSVNLNEKIYYHRLGSPQADDVLVYERPDRPEWNLEGQVTEDGRFLVITISKGTDRKYQVYYRDLAEPYAAPVALVKDFDHEYSFLGNDGPEFYFRTDRDAPNKKVVAVIIDEIDEAADDADALPARDVIAEMDMALTSVGFVGNLLVAEYLKDAASHVEVFETDGRQIRVLDLPGLGSAEGFGGRRNSTETFYSFSNFTTPTTIYRYDTITGQTDLWKQASVDFDPEEFTVKQIFYTSKDGTRVPMFLAHREGISLDGKNPTLLFGYGGFAISLTPSFSAARLAWLEMGGVFAMPNLRGGGEYGETWHQGGAKLNKQNVFDDFIAAGEWLIENGYTSRQKLAISGRSNGGLLVGACMTQRPDLFAACLPAVGVMDMLRFHQFTAGRYWVDDYGSAEDADQFEALRAYSPYHNITEGTAYPPTLVTTADTDDRVVPGHSFKFAAAMQAAQSGDAPILLRIETRAGHGGGTPTQKLIDLAADELAFLARHLGM
jgi:prolyl oligopeptidase